MFKGKFSEVDWINKPSGVLALKEHVGGIAYNPVNENEAYVLPAALDELANFGGATFTALGYSSDPNEWMACPSETSC
eukprot:4553636-Pleurochrysis_carterae.AAC.1